MGRRAHGLSAYSYYTNARGEFVARIPADRRSLRCTVQARGYVSYHNDNLQTLPEAVVLQKKPQLRVRVRTTGAVHGEMLLPRTIALHLNGAELHRKITIVPSAEGHSCDIDWEGEFELYLVGNETSHLGHECVPTTDPITVHFEPGESREVTLTVDWATQPLRVLLRDESGSPIEGAGVRVLLPCEVMHDQSRWPRSRRRPGLRPWRWYPQRTDATGSVQTNRAGRGGCTILISHPEYLDEVVDLGPQSHRGSTVEVVLQHGSSIALETPALLDADQGSDEAGWSYECSTQNERWSQQALTVVEDSESPTLRWVHNVPPGPATILVKQKRAYQITTFYSFVVPEENAAPMKIRAFLAPALVLLDGVPVETGRLTAVHAEQPDTVSYARVTEGGRFQLLLFEPGDYNVCFHHKGNQLIDARYTLPAAEPWTLHAKTIDTVTASLTFVYPDGAPVEGHGRLSGNGHGHQFRTGPEGFANFFGVAPGVYTAYFYGGVSKGYVKRVPLAIRESMVATVTLPRSRRIWIEATTSDGSVVDRDLTVADPNMAGSNWPQWNPETPTFEVPANTRELQVSAPGYATALVVLPRHRPGISDSVFVPLIPAAETTPDEQ